MSVEGNKLITATAHTSQIPPCLFNQHLIAIFPPVSLQYTHARVFTSFSVLPLITIVVTHTWIIFQSRPIPFEGDHCHSCISVLLQSNGSLFPSHSSESRPTHFNPTWAKYNIVTVFESLSSGSFGVFAMSLIKTTPDTLQSTLVKRNPVLNHCFRPERWFNRKTITSTTPLSNWCVLKALMQITIIIHTSVSF